MRTILNILNFYPWRFRHHSRLATRHPGQHHSDCHALPLTRSCWEITRLSLFPYGNEAIHVDELEPGRKNGLLNAGGTVLNILWFIFFRLGGSCLIAHFRRYSSVPDYHRHPGGDREFPKSPPSPSVRWVRRVVSVETARAAREANARRRFQ